MKRQFSFLDVDIQFDVPTCKLILKNSKWQIATYFFDGHKQHFQL